MMDYVRQYVIVDTDASPPTAIGPMPWVKVVDTIREDLREGLSDEVYAEMYSEMSDETVIAEWIDAGEGAWSVAWLLPDCHSMCKGDGTADAPDWSDKCACDECQRHRNWEEV
jgi:hypothetical protein